MTDESLIDKDFNPDFKDPVAPYIELLKSMYEKEVDVINNERTGTGTISGFGENITFDLRQGRAPFLTQRKLPMKSLIGELIWFITGSTDVKELQSVYRCNFWDEWQSKEGSIGPLYGAQWRDADGVDQLNRVLKEMMEFPFSRRHIVSAWNPKYIPPNSGDPCLNPDKGLMALAPCHWAYQFNIAPNEDTEEESYYIDLMYNQRSADLLLGVPVNIASYYIFLKLIAKYLTIKTGKEHVARKMICSFGNYHIYKNHTDALKAVISKKWHKGATFEAPECVVELFENNNLTPERKREIQNEIFRNVKDYNAWDNFKIPRNV